MPLYFYAYIQRRLERKRICFRYIHALLFMCQCFTKRTIKNGVNSNIYFVKNCRNLSQIMESISHSGITNIEDG